MRTGRPAAAWRSAARAGAIAGLAAAAAALVVLPAGSASARPVADWQSYQRTGLVSVASLIPGTLEDRDGNWHTVVLSVNGADGVTGQLVDWSCDPGVLPNYQDAEEDWICTAETVYDIANAVDEDGRSLVSVTVDGGARELVVTGDVVATDYDGGSSLESISVVARAHGPAYRSVLRAVDGSLREATVIRDHTRARGRVLGVKLHERFATVEASSLVAITTSVLPRDLRIR